MDKELESDIAIIGAGPAGIMASLWLIKNNTPHILIDSNSFPREKPCGDIITSKVIRRLNEIDPAIIRDMAAKGFLTPIKGTVLYVPNYNTIDLKFKGFDGNESIPSCYSVQRAHFDDYLFKLVQQSKLVTILTDCFIREIRKHNNQFELLAKNDRKINTKLIIAATGSNSTITKELGGIEKENKHFAVGVRAYFKGVQYEESYAELYLDKTLFPAGGVYITPLSNGICNVNIVVRKDQLLKSQLNLTSSFEKIIQDNPILKEKFKFATRISDFKGGGLFLATRKRRISGDGFILVGDAAGLIDLVSANGIPQAMISGQLAAKQALKCIDANDYSASTIYAYEKQLYREINGDVSMGKMINPLLASSFFKWVFLVSLNYIAKRCRGNSQLVELLYAKHPVRTFIKPSFYYNLFVKKL